MKIILFQPQIPQNTGNIVRTCANTGNKLVLVRPLGFDTSNRRLKRAGLDYWEGVDVSYTDDLIQYLEASQAPFYFFSSRATALYTEIAYTPEDQLIFGSETSGLPEELWEKWPHLFYTIPKNPQARCLNLSNAVAVTLYEAWRQQSFCGSSL